MGFPSDKKTFKRRLNEGCTEICFLKQREANNVSRRTRKKKINFRTKVFWPCNHQS